MTRKQRMENTLNFQPVDRIAREIWALPGVTKTKGEALARLRERYPADITSAPYRLGDTGFEQGQYARIGTYTDYWGCVWEVKQDGIIGEIKKPILADDQKLRAYHPPMEALDHADLQQITDLRQAQPDAFLLASSHTLFERMQFLRGTEQLFMDLAYDDPIAYTLRDHVHQYNLRLITMLAQTPVDAVSMNHDWGTQRALLISPQIWRHFFKPLYREYFDILHRHGKRVFFHSDGFIEEIYPDFIDLGVHALNSQLFCMDMEKLGREYAGKIVFWGEMDRQYLLPFGTPAQIKQGVRRAARALMPNGIRTGVIAQCEWGIDDPDENILAVFEEWDRV